MPSHLSVTSDVNTAQSTFSFAVDSGDGTGDNADKVLIVVVRHGDGTLDVTHSTPTYNGVSLTQVLGVTSVNGNGRRRKSVWKLADPANGSNTLSGGFGEAVNAYSVDAVIVNAADDVDLTTDAYDQGSGTTATVDITPSASDSLLYGSFMANSGGITWTPGSGSTEVRDADATNHSFSIVHEDSAGTTAQTIDATLSSSDSWGVLALEVTAVSGVTGSADITEPVDTVSASGSVVISGSAAITEPVDTVSASGGVLISGTADIAEPVDSVSASGGVTITGSASITEPVDVVEASGATSDTRTGSADITEPVDTVAASGGVLIQASAAITEPVDSISGLGSTIESVDHIEGNTYAFLAITGAGRAPLRDRGFATAPLEDSKGDA